MKNISDKIEEIYRKTLKIIMKNNADKMVYIKKHFYSDVVVVFGTEVHFLYAAKCWILFMYPV